MKNLKQILDVQGKNQPFYDKYFLVLFMLKKLRAYGEKNDNL